jgi:hypothetical protein
MRRPSHPGGQPCASTTVAGIYTRDVVHDQLAPQKIYFPEKGDELPPELNQYAGQQVDTGPEAKAYADDYIGAHLEGMLLNAWGWGTLATIATIAGVVLILVGAVLLAIPLLAAREAKREANATEPVSVEPGVPAPA